MTRITEIGNKGKLSTEFDSVGDVFRVIRKLGWTPKRSKSSDTRREGGGSFYTFSGLQDCLDTFENHPERIRTFDPLTDRLETPDSPGKDVLYDITGDFLDIDRYLTEEPEMFGNAVMGNPKNLFCTINVLTSYVWSTRADYLTHRQKRILRLVDWLESQGVRCQVVATADSKVQYMSAVVKSFQDPFNVNDLAVVSHPDWLRRVMFLIMEQSKTWSDGYGNASDYDRKMFKYEPQPEDGLYIYVGGYHPLKSTDELDEHFDRVEESVKKLIDDGLTYNEDPFIVGKGGSGW